MGKPIIIDFNQTLTKTVSSFSANIQFTNCYPIKTNGGRSETCLVPIYGSTLSTQANPDRGNGCRGGCRSSTGPQSTNYSFTNYFVFGDTLFRQSRTGNFVRIGNVNLSTSMCSFAESQDQSLTNVWLYVCDGITIYKWNATADDSTVASTFAEIASLPKVNGSISEYARPNYITYSDYRLMFSCSNSNQWFYSGLNDDVFNSAKFYTPESSADFTKRVINGGGALWTFGDISFEQWNRTGNSANPYSSTKPKAGYIGLHSGDSIGIIDDKMLFLGDKNRVYMVANGNSPVMVSDDSIERIIESCKSADSAKGLCITENGQQIYCLTFKSSNVTISYNITTGKWHNRSSSSDGSIHFWDVNVWMTGYNNEIIICNSVDNSISIAKSDKSVDYLNRPITRIYQSPVTIDDLKFFRVKRFVIDTETGTSNSYTMQGQLFVEISWDAGKTFGTIIERDCGYAGNYQKSTEIFGLGAGKNFVYRISSSSPIPINIYQLTLDIERTNK